MRIPLGPFDLVKPLAKGGMGEVWAAVHRAQNLEVAIKVITADYARHPGFVASLRHEVRAMASLSHPHIVRVLDQGEVDVEAARASDYQLVEGSPFIAMEMVAGETLGAYVFKLEWDDVREVLIKLLGALGHAHARGVLHRDLKPANLLLPAGGTTWQVKLTDFGIAHPLSTEKREGPRVAGTPHFMSPEQRRGDWRKYRPATDLYAVGRIASALLKRDEDGLALVPPGFNDWMARILAATPQHRFVFAADAAWALKKLGEPTDRLDLYFDPGRPATTVRTTQAGDLEFVESTESERPLCTTSFDKAERPPMPASWRTPTPKPPTQQFKNAGSGLFGIRTIEIVGRVAQRNQLWSLLSRVHAENRIHIVTVRGPEGIGKATLLRWLAERSEEVGAAWALHAAFSPVPGGADPLASMVANELNTLGLSYDEALPLVRDLAGLLGESNEADVAMLTELGNPSGTKNTSRFRFSSTEERLVGHARYLRWVAQRRVVLAQFEEVQWGLEAIQLVDKALDLGTERPLPMLFALSVDDQALATCPVERMALEALRERAGDAFHEIQLEPLPPTDQRALVSSLLGLDPTLVARAAEGTEGNPLHAVQQVTRWFEAKMLVEGPSGLCLADGNRINSASVEDLWKYRLAAFLEERPVNDAVALELLAVLGHEVPRSDWARITRRAGFQPSRWLVDGLVEHGMLRVSQGGTYSFVHASLRSAVLDHAEKAGRLRSHHQNCADLVKRYATGADRDGRVGEHLLYGGRAQAALHYLYRGAEASMQEGDTSRVRELIVLWNRALDELNLPDTDPRHGDGLFLEGRAALRSFQSELATRLAERLRNRAHAHGWPKHHARAMALLGRIALTEGDPAARELLDSAVHEAEAVRERLTQAEALYDLAQLYTARGDVRRAARKLATARGLYVAMRSTAGETQCLLAAAIIARHEDRPDEALTLADAARQLAARDGSRVRQADALTIAGEVHRKEGRVELAEKAYRVAMHILRVSGGPYRSITCELNIAQLLQQQGEHDRALELIGSCIERLHRTGRRGTQAVAHTLMLPSLAVAGNRVAFERHLSAGQALYTETQVSSTDAVDALSEASRLARDAGWTPEANKATLLWRRMKQVHESPATLPPAF